MAGCGALSEVSRHLSTRQGSGAAIDYDGRNVWLLIHILVDQDPKMRKEAGLGYKPQGSVIRVLLPPSRPCLPKTLQPPQTVPPAGDQVFKPETLTFASTWLP